MKNEGPKVKIWDDELAPVIKEATELTAIIASFPFFNNFKGMTQLLSSKSIPSLHFEQTPRLLLPS